MAPAGESAATSCWRDMEMRAWAVIRRYGAANFLIESFTAFEVAVPGQNDKIRLSGQEMLHWYTEVTLNVYLTHKA